MGSPCKDQKPRTHSLENTGFVSEVPLHVYIFQALLHIYITAEFLHTAYSYQFESTWSWSDFRTIAITHASSAYLVILYIDWLRDAAPITGPA